MKYRSALYNVRGLGSARSGTHHWWMQRVTAIALVPLVLWLGFSIARLSGLGFDAARAWLHSPLNAVLLLGAITALFYHARLGGQVVIEDYLHSDGLKVAALIGLKFLTLLLGLACALAVLRIYVTG
jgi:succinate dehydrogenase / fumarate reductase membrane anchor subunit